MKRGTRSNVTRVAVQGGSDLACGNSHQVCDTGNQVGNVAVVAAQAPATDAIAEATQVGAQEERRFVARAEAGQDEDGIARTAGLPSEVPQAPGEPRKLAERLGLACE